MVCGLAVEPVGGAVFGGVRKGRAGAERLPESEARCAACARDRDAARPLSPRHAQVHAPVAL